MDIQQAKFATRAVHAGQHPDHDTGALVAPLYLTSTYVFTPEKMDRYLAGDKEGIFTYGRSRNPTQNGFQTKVAALEGGEAALAAGSGMAAIALAVLGTVHSGDHIIACRTLYGGTFALFSKIFEDLKIEVSFLPEMTTAALDAALRPNTRAVYLETILNPTLEVVDLPTVLAWARGRGLRSFVDNTFTTPFLCRPLELGADVVVHSTTKYINGHGDHVGGIIVSDAGFIEQLRSSVYQELGPVPEPLRLLAGAARPQDPAPAHARPLRQRHGFRLLAGAPPPGGVGGLPRAAQPPPARAGRTLVQGGYGGMVGFCVRGGLKEAQRVINRLQMAYYAVSLGDLDTLVEHPATMTHGKIDPATRARMGIPDNYIRVSVGVEDVDDIIADFHQALTGR